MEIIIGNISIKQGRDGNIWMENEIGEGMSIREALLMECLEKFFKDHF